MLKEDLIKTFSCVNNSELSKKIAYHLKQTVDFKIDNVGRYYIDHYMPKGWQKGDEYTATKINPDKEFPNVAPLAPDMWFEYNGLSVNLSPSEQFGCLITVAYDQASGLNGLPFTPQQEVRWVISALTCVKTNHLNEPIPRVFDMSYSFFLDKNGRILHTEYFSRDGDDEKGLSAEIVIALTAICFAHCKGTEIAEHKPSRQVRRQAERKKEPTYSYHTIDIHPSARVLKEEGDIEHNGLAKALHICRGNFAHYTADKPLFGKYVGTVYRPMHVRGKAENGVVEKDYRVHAE